MTLEFFYNVCYHEFMKKSSIKPIFFLAGLALFLGNFFIASQAQAALELIKAQGQSAVYYLDSRSVRHTFPNDSTFKSWYGGSFSKVVAISAELMKTYPLGKNITIRPGTHLVKITSAPQVYAVEQGGVLREITDESIAEAIYGEDWQKKVVDVPDVFFENYLIGAPLNHDYLVPGSVLLQDKTTKKYYYKTDDVIRPFESAQAVSANNFKLSDALVSGQSFYVRERPIAAWDKNIFNPTAEPWQDRRDCENKKLKAAMIFVADKNYEASELEKIELIKKELPDRFSWATDGLAEIDASYPIIILLNDGYLLTKRNDGTMEVKNELINTFFDNNPDLFDFIFVWTNFKVPADKTNEIAHFVPITNKWEGVNKPMLDRSQVYGSFGKLKGVMMMNNINNYEISETSKLNETLNIVLHEILHQWAAYIEFINEAGQKSKALLRPEDFSHWSNYLGLISPVGGLGWVEAGNGTFISSLAQQADTNLRKYSKLDLYLMGLIPKQLMTDVFYINPEPAGALGNLILGQLKKVTIDQIIKASGEVKCSNELPRQSFKIKKVFLNFLLR